MQDYEDIMRAERCRTMNYGADVSDECEIRCPVCDSADWDFLVKDGHGDVIGCQDCVSKVYLDEILN